MQSSDYCSRRCTSWACCKGVNRSSHSALTIKTRESLHLLDFNALVSVDDVPYHGDGNQKSPAEENVRS